MFMAPRLFYSSEIGLDTRLTVCNFIKSWDKFTIWCIVRNLLVCLTITFSFTLLALIKRPQAEYKYMIIMDTELIH